ncbi:MAG: zinc ABC transporter substrate-binding protein [Gammaproteobacteria bacterium]|nr:zinc ABC transporter substrate-binding protein [Gammaproteobacteria bacterium]MBU1723256.1 zinc ABC transporter substrate-binding protein [Gammaproteobacteria bacterium]MBU2003863.1 zinc ABC transporter substrate-binding protein [Gammaproteobacteria bacterium]
MLRILTILLLLCLPVLSSCQQESTAKPVIVTTIKPVQALAYAVAGGVNSPLEVRQLLPDGASPHHYSLKPSDMRTLGSALAVFRIGSGLETFLDKPLASLDPHTLIVTLTDTPGIQHLPARSPHKHDAEETASEHEQHTAGDAAPTEDLHLWLNPQNAIAMSHEIARVLAQVDPDHKADYARNTSKLVERILATDEHIRQQLEPLRKRPYLSFHDAWQHFDTHYGLNFAGAVTLDASRLPGARHVQDIRHIVEQKQAICLFQEPQFSPSLIKTLMEGSTIRIGELDPLGMKLPLDENTYTNLMQAAADNFERCLR